MSKVKTKKKTVDKLITLPIDEARIIRDIAEEKGFVTKTYIEYLVHLAVEQRRKKQLSLL